MKCLFTLAVVPVITYFIMETLFHSWLPTNFIFNHAELEQICKDVVATRKELNSTTWEMFEDLQKRISDKYGSQYVNELNHNDWVFNNAGGAMGQMFILHASISEYLIIFGSTVGTEGHSGMHYSNDYFTILQGHQYAGFANAVEREVYGPGDQHWLKKGEVKQYGMEPETFALELAQGWIPTMLPFGFLDAISSTLDFYNFGLTAWLTAKDMLKNLLQSKF